MREKLKNLNNLYSNYLEHLTNKTRPTELDKEKIQVVTNILAIINPDQGNSCREKIESLDHYLNPSTAQSYSFTNKPGDILCRRGEPSSCFASFFPDSWAVTGHKVVTKTNDILATAILETKGHDIRLEKLEDYKSLP